LFVVPFHYMYDRQWNRFEKFQMEYLDLAVDVKATWSLLFSIAEEV